MSDRYTIEQTTDGWLFVYDGAELVVALAVLLPAGTDGPDRVTGSDYLAEALSAERAPAGSVDLIVGDPLTDLSITLTRDEAIALALAILRAAGRK